VPSSVVITGGLGFIGSTILDQLIRTTDYTILVIDDLSGGRVIDENIISTLLNPRVIWLPETEISRPQLISDFEIKGIIHFGAIASTSLEVSSKKIFQKNVYFTDLIFKFAEAKNAQIIFASSAAIYGNSQSISSMGKLAPTNLYGLSKAMNESSLLRYKNLNATVLRLFNVYGLGEAHKGSMVSMPLNMYQEASGQGQITIFQKDQRKIEDREAIYRDFIHVEDVAKLVEMILQSGSGYGIIDVGVGFAMDTYALAQMVQEFFTHSTIVTKTFSGDWGSYQKFTKANLSWLDKTNLDWAPRDTESGIKNYLQKLNSI